MRELYLLFDDSFFTELIRAYLTKVTTKKKVITKMPLLHATKIKVPGEKALQQGFDNKVFLIILSSIGLRCVATNNDESGERTKRTSSNHFIPTKLLLSISPIAMFCETRRAKHDHISQWLLPPWRLPWHKFPP